MIICHLWVKKDDISAQKSFTRKIIVLKVAFKTRGINAEYHGIFIVVNPYKTRVVRFLIFTLSVLYGFVMLFLLESGNLLLSCLLSLKPMVMKKRNYSSDFLIEANLCFV